jgi:hypothetical protein
VGTMRIIDRTGDSTVEWDLDDKATVERAEELFRQLIGQRQMAFGRPAGATVEEAERLYAFAPESEEILWVRPIQGG